ncbi:MAG: holo-ACP synthase [Planctomycetes bacterium]|nr:holo-ACP synthase [Planctomycetota bacterium]MBI3845636.1 holo-ACP synthase [Planctomycetota bacterium]
MKPLVGIDLVDIVRVERLLARYGPRFVDRVFTVDEARYCASRSRPAVHFAARFAAKEAVLKALGTGFGLGAELREVEVLRGSSGALSVRLHGRALTRAQGLGVAAPAIALSISHTDSVAAAQVVALAVT